MGKKKDAEDHLEEVGGKIEDIFPTTTTHEHIQAIMEAIPKEHHDKCWEFARHLANTQYRAFAGAAAALLARELFEANSSYGMWAGVAPNGTTLGRGANAVPGTVYQFISYMNGAVGPQNGAVNFTDGQRFFGLTTGPMDSNASWTFAGNTVKILSDAISGIETDTSFVNWRPEIVKSRLIKGEYETFEIVCQTVIPFTASAYIPVGAPAAPSIEGLSVLFWDERCLSTELKWLNRETMSFSGMVNEFVRRAEGGKISRRMLTGMLPEHLRRGRYD